VTDEQLLIDRARRGDNRAFRELVERSKINVYRLAYDLTGNRFDAEDLSQDVFVRAYRSLPNFRGDSKWGTWLYRITVNICMDYKRTMKRRPLSYPEMDADEFPAHDRSSSGSISPDQSAESAVMQQHIERALTSLTQQERTVFVLRHYHDLPLKQIADTMQIAEGTVKSYLFRAIQRLKKELAPYRGDVGLREAIS
jgi:RNA polymerase sigma-70 factor, ECF subfamily